MTEASLNKEYSKIAHKYLDFLGEIKRVITRLLNDNDIPIAFEVSARIKEIDSIIEKHNSGRFKLRKTITELNDLVGLRIVVLFPEYKQKVIKFLLDEFQTVIEYNPSNMEVDKFGYSSEHLILKIKKSWIETPTWKYHQGKKFEIQVRTLSEHVWAETSHALFYKREENMPNANRRDLYRLSALLEVVDEKMQTIKSSVEEHFELIRKLPYEEILKMDLNSETFKRVMLHKSNGLYNLDERQNTVLSSNIENNYNILNTSHLDSIIPDDIIKEVGEDLSGFVNKVLWILEENKKTQDKNRTFQEP